eukprot:TRINITY_DN101082_c0_g1_i1.p1 TRINITY_DN101082_c0_g1~~TRINITY_DN101082_c0_g1_i1.p1  ORF type:complete len:423 (-),score=111.80 TRINITY_DN101082_c0_g1_i1:87-1355(-)
MAEESDPVALKEEGNAKFKAGKYREAIDAYSKAIALDSSQHLAYSNRSAAYLKVSEAEKALADAEECVKLSPSWPKGYNRQAAALQALKRFQEALAACDAGLAMGGEDATLRKMKTEVTDGLFCTKLLGKWHGTVSDEMGGYEQELEFSEDKKITVSVLGNVVDGIYSVRTTYRPHEMDLMVSPPGAPPQPPALYICKLDAEGLHLCVGVNPAIPMRPTSFSGPGYVLMKAGAIPDDDASDVAGLSPLEKLRKCSEGILQFLPLERPEQPTEYDTPEEFARKMRVHVDIKKAMHTLEKRFGQTMPDDIMKAVMMNDFAPSLDGLKDTKEFQELAKEVARRGLNQAAPPPPPGPSPPVSDPPKAKAPLQQEKAAPPTKPPPKTEGEKASGGGLSSSSTALVVGSAVAIAAVAAVAIVLSRKKR